tara:strand:- start:535 stop:786 length:252 start_codon:yes stop_codon:yes gene_type:complete
VITFNQVKELSDKHPNIIQSDVWMDDESVTIDAITNLGMSVTISIPNERLNHSSPLRFTRSIDKALEVAIESAHEEGEQDVED